MSVNASPSVIVYIDKCGHFRGVANVETGELIDARLVMLRKSKKDKKAKKGDGLNSRTGKLPIASEQQVYYHPFTSAGHDLRTTGTSQRMLSSSSISSSSSSIDQETSQDMAVEAALFHHAHLGPASATPLGTKFEDCLFDYKTLSPSSGAQRAGSISDNDDSESEDESQSDSDVDDEGSAQPTDSLVSNSDVESDDMDVDVDADSEEERSMVEASEASDKMMAAESASPLLSLHSERGGRGGGRGFGGGARTFGGGGGGGVFRSSPAPRMSIAPARIPSSPRTRMLNPPGYARTWTRAPRSYNSRVWSRRYRPFAPFLPLFYASLAVPWSLWYPRSRYVFLTNPYRLQYGLPLLPIIPPNAPLGWIETQLLNLRATYTHFRVQGYEIVPRFYAAGTGRFVWVMTNDHPGHVAVYNSLGANVYGQ